MGPIPVWSRVADWHGRAPGVVDVFLVERLGDVGDVSRLQLPDTQVYAPRGLHGVNREGVSASGHVLLGGSVDARDCNRYIPRPKVVDEGVEDPPEAGVNLIKLQEVSGLEEENAG